MDAIFKVNNVYVPVKNNEVRDGIEVTNLNELIISTEEKTSASLYGGRVWVEKVRRNYRTYYTLTIDGIEIYEIDLGLSYFNECDAYNIEKVAAYLNQIENLGIETFLDNYKKQLENLRDKLEGISVEMQQNEGDNEKLNVIRKSIIKITSFLFALYVNMNAGIEMQDYIDAYNTIINMYF